MSVAVQSPSEGINTKVYPSTMISLLSSDSSFSDSDHGYSTPVEHFADDEQHVEQIVQVPHTSADDRVPSDTVEVTIDPELQEKILRQVEWYFSDENLLKDSFLMKHINRNKLGYVSLKLVASLRKVKALTKDWRIVLMSVKESTVLALNEEESKVRRVEATPEVDYTHVSKTVLVTNYPHAEPTIQEIEQRFGKYGDVTLVRILHSGRAIPLDVKPCRTNHPNLGKELCVLVEYESEEGAKKAHKKFLEQQNWRDDLKVEMLSSKKTPKDKEQQPQQHTAETSQPEQKTVGKQENKRRRKRNVVENKIQHNASPRWIHDDENQAMSEGTPSPRHSREGTPSKQVRRKYSPPCTSSSSDIRKGGHGSGSRELTRKFLHPEAHREYSSDSGCSRSTSESPKCSPEPMKRFFSGDLGGSWRHTEKSVRPRNCISRQPLGPDGSRGFAFRRNPVHISVQAC